MNTGLSTSNLKTGATSLNTPTTFPPQETFTLIPVGLYMWLALGHAFFGPVWPAGTRLPALSRLFHWCCSSLAGLLVQLRDCSFEPYTGPGLLLAYLTLRLVTGGRSLEGFGALEAPCSWSSWWNRPGPPYPIGRSAQSRSLSDVNKNQSAKPEEVWHAV